MKKSFVFPALVALACVWPAAAFSAETAGIGEIAMGEFQKMLVPAVASLIAWVTMYGLSWGKSGLEKFFQKRNATRALKILNACSQAVDFVAKNSGVDAAKAAVKELNPNASLPEELQKTAMQTAIVKTREIAAAKNLTQYLPPDDADLELMLENAVAARKKGENNLPSPFAKAEALAPLQTIRGWVPSGSKRAGGSAG